MDEAEERRIWKRDAAELRRSEVYPALLRLRAALRRQTPADRLRVAGGAGVLRSVDPGAPWGGGSAPPARECLGRGRPQGPPLPHKVGRLTPAPRPAPS